MIPALPDYNQHVTIPDPQHPPAWFDKMKMRHGDFAYRWLVEIRHNSDPIEPGRGQRDLFPHPARCHAAHERLHDHGRRKTSSA